MNHMSVATRNDADFDMTRHGAKVRIPYKGKTYSTQLICVSLDILSQVISVMMMNAKIVLWPCL